MQQQSEVISESVAQADSATQVAQTEKPIQKKSKWRHWLCCIPFVLLLIIAIPVAFLATGKGQQMALEMIAKSVDGLEIGKVEGSLQQGLNLSDTRFTMDGVTVDAKQADLHIGFECLFDKQTCIENLALKDAQIAIDTSKLPPSAPKEDKPVGDISLPMGISLKQISVDNLSLSVDEMDMHLDHFHSAISGEGKNLNLAPTSLEGLTLTLAPQAVDKTEKSAKEDKKQPIDWQAIEQQLAQPLLTKQQPIKLPLNVNIDEFVAKDIHILQKQKDENGEMKDPRSLVNVSLLALKGKSDEKTVSLSQLDLQSDRGNVKGQGKLTLEGNYPLDWQLVADSPTMADIGLPASQADLQLNGELFGTTVLAVKTSGAVNASVSGNIQLSEPRTPLNLHIQSPQIQYPFMPEKGKDPLKLDNVDLKLSGDLLNYQLDASTALSGMGLPKGNIALKGQGELTQFNLERLNLNALDGSANLNGKLDWRDGIEWQSQLVLDNIHTKSILPEWAAVLSGKFDSTGYAGRGENGQEWAVAVSDMDMNGNLFQKNLQLKGNLTANHETLLNVPQASLIYGENVIGLKGVLGEKSDFIADINAPNLKGLVPNLTAGVKGNVKLQGEITKPVLDLDLVANNVAYQDLKLQHLTAKGSVTTDQMIKGDIELTLRQFQQGDIRIESANVTAVGSEQQHRLTLKSKGDPVGADLQISGKFDRSQQKWQGELSHVAIQTPVGEWKNDKAVQISYNNQQIQADISAHCWRNPKLAVCFPQSFKAGKEGKIPFDIKQLDLAIANEFLDKDSQLSGLVNLKGDAAWFTSKAPQVNVELNSDRIQFVQKMDNRKFPITLTPVKVVANLAENNLKLKTDIKLENNGTINSDLQLKDIAKSRALSGNLNINNLNLDVIKPLLSSEDKVAGEIDARLTLGGTALSPLLYGNLNLSGLKAKSAIMPFDVTGGELTLNFNGASSTLKGNVQTKESNLLLEGDANWKKLDAWHTRVSAKAERFRVDIPNIAKVDVSPNIEVKATPKALNLTGNVDIPWARIAVEELPESAVSVSADEVIMDLSVKQTIANKLALKNIPKQQQGMAINADISVNIGDDVKLDAYGLKTGLYGKLKVRQGSKGLGLYGQVNLKNGTFASFGQDLVVRKGLISFTGLPSQPTLDIEAIRNPEAIEDPSVVAGVKVTGIADNPDVKLFSNPPMAQDQILSYILTGRPLEGGGDSSSSNSIAAALVGLSLSKGSKIVGGVGSTFGITDLNVTTAGIGDNTKVVVTGSLTPKFKVKYGVGLFAPLTELTLRYRLAPSLYLQWVSSINQAVDLLYRFEFD